MITFYWIGIIILSSLGVLAIISALRLPRLRGDQAIALASRSLRQIKRLIILVVGVTVVIVGIIMLVAPGPGLVVIPIGLGVLATEFVWAKRLLQNYKRYAQQFAARAEAHEFSRPRPALAIVVVLATLACIAAAYWLREWPIRNIMAIGGGALGLETAWCVLMIQRHRKRATAPHPPVPPPTSVTQGSHDVA